MEYYWTKQNSRELTVYYKYTKCPVKFKLEKVKEKKVVVSKSDMEHKHKEDEPNARRPIAPQIK